MPLIVLIVVAVAVGGVVVLIGRLVPRANVASPGTALAAGGTIEETVVRHRRLRRFVAARLDPKVATGLALTAALVISFLGALVLAILAYLIRSNPQLRRLDHGVAQWGHDHAGSVSTDGLNVVTSLGVWWVVLPVAAAVVAIESFRVPSRWIVPFVAVLLGGEEAITLGVKHLADRARPTLNPVAATLGPSFPSGHSATAAVFYAGVALLLARRRSRSWRTFLAGAAAAIAVAVAASRVLLDVHWLSDVVAGVMVGWGWFAVTSIAFGGRLLQFGAPAEPVIATAQGAEEKRKAARGTHARFRRA